MHATQVVLIQDFRRLLQANLGRPIWCDFTTLGNFADYPGYPKFLQSKQLWNNMLPVVGFGIGHALELRHFATTHSTRETQK